MLVSVQRTKINKKPENKVTSSAILAPHRRQTRENLKMHDEGIFSKKIFGNLRKCDCGELTKEGFCKKCNCRVVSIKNMPEYYIDLTINVPVAFADYESICSAYNLDIDDVRGIMEYRKFLYLLDGENNYEFVEFDPEKNMSLYEDDKILIGIDALRFLNIPNDWINENTTDFLSIPHPIYRPIVIDDRDMPYITGINHLYEDIIKNINNIVEMDSLAQGRQLYLMVKYNVITKLYDNIINSLFDELQNVKYSIIKSEIISHPISGAIRGTLINRHDIHEDVILVGDTFIETLYPFLYKKHNGNMVEINKELIDGNAIVLLNRPPTISHMSIIALKPRIASIYPYGHCENTNRCLEHNYDYINENPDNFGLFEDKIGDIERFGQGEDDGIDTIGVRCIATNPIMMDGLQGDYDGDVLLLIALYSEKAKKEAEKILPSKSYTNYANGKIRNHIIEDFIYAEKE